MPTIDRYVSKHPLISFVNAHAALVGYTGPESYATGGDLIEPNDVKLGRIEDIWPVSGLAINGAGAIRHLMFDASSGLMIWYDNADPHAEIANGTDLSGFTTKLFVIEG